MPESLQAVDLFLLRLLTSWHAPWLDTLMSWISTSGAASALWLTLAIIVLSRRRDRAAAWRVMLTVGLCYLMLDAVLKPAIARPRPSILATAPARELPPLPRSLSFPSGHAYCGCPPRGRGLRSVLSASPRRVAGTASRCRAMSTSDAIR